MRNSAKSILIGSVAGFLMAASLSLPAFAQYTPQNGESQYSTQSQPQQAPPQSARQARPGAINYVEGHASIDGQVLNPDSVGSAILDRDQTLTTQSGKVEVLLTPGVFLRVADNSEVKMISPDLANTETEVEQGRAMVEVTDISKDNNIRVDVNGSSTKLLKRGLYDFDADHSQIRVLKGKVDVYANNQKMGVGENHEVTLNATDTLKARGFGPKLYADDFYRWSGLRSGYLAEADADTAGLYVNGGPGWYGAGWYWDPWFSAYTFIPGDGIFYSPFGWGFYSPYAVWGSPFFYGGFYGHRHYFGDFHGPYGHGFEPRGGFYAHGGGFHGGGGFHSGGGFQGGSGGFHGGGGGGGGHH